jgi:4'-phosphopantetheinyl transferase
MPVFSLLTFAPDCQVALWQITETEPDLANRLTLSADETDELAGVVHPGQRVEWLACRVTLRWLVAELGLPYAGVVKDEFGKPHLSGSAGQVSLSHTGGWAAAAYHPTQAVGLDIEPLREQFGRVVPRVLSPTEISHAGGEVGRLAVYWCAKEALYKRYGKRKLTFRDHLLIDPFQDGQTELTGHVRLPDHDETLVVHVQPAGPGLLAVVF